jgi:hypothetical protein
VIGDPQGERDAMTRLTAAVARGALDHSVELDEPMER